VVLFSASAVVGFSAIVVVSQIVKVQLALVAHNASSFAPPGDLRNGLREVHMDASIVD